MEQYQGLTAEMYRAVVAIVDERTEGTRVLRQDFDRVAGRMDRVEAALDRLVQAQARSEERMDRVEATLDRLVQAQVRSEERMDRVEATLDRLVQVQARTEEQVNRLGIAVGSLAENIGFGLEDVGRLLLPPYLHKHYGIQLEGLAGEELGRRFFQVEGQPPIEVDLYGEGRRDGQRVVVLGEAKSRIGGGIVKEFADILKLVEPLVEGEVWRVMFGYYIHPSAQPVAEEHHILLVASYQR